MVDYFRPIDGSRQKTTESTFRLKAIFKYWIRYTLMLSISVHQNFRQSFDK